MLISLVVYCLLGAIAGVLAGLLGVGGGIVIVPMLVFAFGWQNFPPDVLMLMALGTSMGSIMFTSISSSLAHSRNKGVQWDAVRNITPGILIGTFCGSFLASHVPARFLQLFFVAFLFFVITQMLSGKKPKPSRHLPGLGGMSVAGGIIGVVSSLVGIGGGTLSVIQKILTRNGHSLPGYKFCMGLVSLSKNYAAQDIENACRALLALSSAPSLKSMKLALSAVTAKRNADDDSTQNDGPSVTGFRRGAGYYGGKSDD